MASKWGVECTESYIYTLSDAWQGHRAHHIILLRRLGNTPHLEYYDPSVQKVGKVEEVHKEELNRNLKIDIDLEKNPQEPRRLGTPEQEEDQKKLMNKIKINPMMAVMRAGEKKQMYSGVSLVLAILHLTILTKIW